MSDEAEEDQQLGRRELLALAGTAITVASGSFLLLGNSDAEPDRNGVSDGQRTGSSQGTGTDGSKKDRVEGENITDYGAKPNPNDPTARAAERNLNAIIDAANAAGNGGSIYVPSGTFFFGHDGTGPDRYLDFGNREPSGISIRGDGPQKSTLAITAHAPVSEQPNQSFGYWNRGYYHGRIDIENIRLNGNYEQIDDNFSDVGGGSWGPQVDGNSDLYLYNVHLRGWHLAGVRGRESLRSATYCTFEDNGIKRHNETNGDSISHHISCAPLGGDECVIKRCHFIDCSGSAVDIKNHDGTIKIHDCYAEGTGANLCKLSAGRRLEIKNVYHVANTKSLERKVDDIDHEDNFHGRNFIQSLGERGTENIILHTESVESRDMSDYAIQASDIFKKGPANIVWKGTMIAFHNTNQVRDEHTIRDRNGGRFTDVDIDRMSVHGSNVQIFETDKSNGRIRTLNRGRDGRLGETGEITIETDNVGAEPVVPDVPLRTEVGINADGRPKTK